MRPSGIATYLPRKLLTQRIGLAIFLASMPLNVLNGHGQGYLADFDHFQGWEVVYLGFLCSSWIFRGEWGGLYFLPIAATSAFTLALPFVDLTRTKFGTRISTWLKAVASMSLVLTFLFMLG